MTFYHDILLSCLAIFPLGLSLDCAYYADVLLLNLSNVVGLRPDVADTAYLDHQDCTKHSMFE